MSFTAEDQVHEILEGIMYDPIQADEAVQTIRDAQIVFVREADLGSGARDMFGWLEETVDEWHDSKVVSSDTAFWMQKLLFEAYRVYKNVLD